MTYEQVETFLRKEINQHLKDLVIFREGNGTYNLFNRYIISKSNSFYKVTIKNTSLNFKFNNIKHAVTYCIFDKRDKFYESKRIIDLDQKLVSLDVDITIEQKLYKKSKNIEDKLIFLAKLNENKFKKKQLELEIESYILAAKVWQDRKFRAKP